MLTIPTTKFVKIAMAHLIFWPAGCPLIGFNSAASCQVEF
jgi:hypothetical protein